jgi:hypothetical protein
MKANIVKSVVALICASAASVYAAATGIGGEEAGMLVWAMIGFGVLVVMLQAVPAMIMLGAMLKAVFSVGDKSSALPKL